ncbi:MAG: radical SAM protein [Fidelibacterota bacterium]
MGANGKQMRAGIHTVDLTPDQRITVTLKIHCLNILDHSAGALWTFDLEGRLVGMYVDGVNYRRTLDNRFFAKSRERIHGETFRSVYPITREAAARLLSRARSLLMKVESLLPEETGEATGRILRTDMDLLEASGREFSRIYLPISILPPDQYLSLVLQITEGCNYNRCLHCNFYRDRPFRIKPLQEIDKHFSDVRRFFGRGLKLRRSVFLGDANALVIPQEKLVPILKRVGHSFPELSRIYSFIDLFTGIKKSSDNFSHLRELGVKRVYLGVESGNPGLLTLLQKPQPIANVIELCRRIKAGGINLGLIFLAGAGGRLTHEEHLRDSVELIEKIPLDRGDMVYVSEFYETNPDYRSALRKLGYPLPGRMELREMASEFKRVVKKVVSSHVAVPIYDIRQFLY